jgi:hypothetical protein
LPENESTFPRQRECGQYAGCRHIGNAKQNPSRRCLLDRPTTEDISGQKTQSAELRAVPEATAKENENRTEKQKFKKQADREDSEKNEGLVLKEFSV